MDIGAGGHEHDRQTALATDGQMHFVAEGGPFPFFGITPPGFIILSAKGFKRGGVDRHMLEGDDPFDDQKNYKVYQQKHVGQKA